MRGLWDLEMRLFPRAHFSMRQGRGFSYLAIYFLSDCRLASQLPIRPRHRACIPGEQTQFCAVLGLETSRFRAVFCASGVVLSRSAPRGTIPSLWLSWIPGFAGRGRRRCEESCAWGFVSLRKLGYWGQTVQGQYLLYIPLPDCPSPWTLVA